MKVMEFERHLADNIIDLYGELNNLTYKHGPYERFIICDNKRREIHEASIKDKVVHQIVYEFLMHLFEPTFIGDSYSSRKYKGSHKAVRTFRYFSRIARDQNSGVYILKCDVRKYFDNIDHATLIGLIGQRIKDDKIVWIIKEIIESYNTKDKDGKGIPLGNVTSQIFANIYLNELDHFVKNTLGIRFYVRYNDDFVIAGTDPDRLAEYLIEIRNFLSERLMLDLPENKTSIRKLGWGSDFLGFTVLPNCVLLRNQTKAKVFERINEINAESYFGILKHCDSYNLRSKFRSMLESDCGAFEDDLC